MSIFYIPEYNCLFNHITKTAGRSIRLGFFKEKLNCNISPGYSMWPIRHKEKYSFAFVRNPYDRIVSAYLFTKRTIKHKYTFKEFLDIAVDNNIGFSQSRLEYPKEYIRHHTLPQTHSFNYLSQTKFIGRFENLDNDFKIICDHIGAEYSKLPKINVNPKLKPKSHTLSQRIYYKFFKEKPITYNDYYCNLFGPNLDLINSYWQQDFSELNYEIAQVKT
tara:strand:- start:323 stop:979 length:657 start_codon:yes stop_codon:yes gene_type:complete